MVLTDSEIVQIIESGASDLMKLARKKAKKRNMHVTGKGATEFLKRLDGYETSAQKILREKLLKSNRSLFSFILRPCDKIFTAKGGSINYNLAENRKQIVQQGISNVSDNLDIKTYLKKVVKPYFVIDPNGVLFIDLDEEGKLQTEIVTTEYILWYKHKGNQVEAIIFEPYKRKLTKNEEKVYMAISEDRLRQERDKLYYRVVDAETDRIYVNDGGQIREMANERLNNFFGFVPSMILGDVRDPNTGLYESIVEDIIEDADMFLRRVSVTNVHELAHLYPRYWSYEQACTKCGGEGEFSYLMTEATDEAPAVYKTETCTSCGGVGYKTRTNPSDELVLKAPMEGEPVLAPNVAGYVQPDLGSAKFYNELIEKAKNTMFQAMWGTTYEQGGKRETATGRFLDAQPVQDRLKDISYTFSRMHKFILDCYGKILLGDRNYESSVYYGNRYILESPDDVLDKYIETSRENVSDITKIDLRNRYFEAEYQNDPIGLANRKKLANIEPFPSLSVGEVAKMEFLAPIEKAKKAYYTQWVNTLQDAEIVFLNEEQLRQRLDLYVNNINIINDDREEVSQRGVSQGQMDASDDN